MCHSATLKSTYPMDGKRLAHNWSSVTHYKRYHVAGLVGADIHILSKLG